MKSVINVIKPLWLCWVKRIWCPSLALPLSDFTTTSLLLAWVCHLVHTFLESLLGFGRHILTWECSGDRLEKPFYRFSFNRNSFSCLFCFVLFLRTNHNKVLCDSSICIYSHGTQQTICSLHLKKLLGSRPVHGNLGGVCLGVVTAST